MSHLREELRPDPANLKWPQKEGQGIGSEQRHRRCNAATWRIASGHWRLHSTLWGALIRVWHQESGLPYGGTAHGSETSAHHWGSPIGKEPSKACASCEVYFNDPQHTALEGALEGVVEPANRTSSSSSLSPASSYSSSPSSSPSGPASPQDRAPSDARAAAAPSPRVPSSAAAHSSPLDGSASPGRLQQGHARVKLHPRR